MQSNTQRRRLGWLSIVVACGLVLAACGDDDDGGDEDSSGGNESSGSVSGEVNVSGSSTVEPISLRAGEGFMAENEDVTVNVDGPGTGDGFELFCNGETDISDASRPIDPEEVAVCEENGVTYTELRVAYDGMAVMTSPNNEAVECLNFADLYALIGPEASGSNWSDAQPIAQELGSTTELPDAELALVGPGPESGTYDSFVEIVITPIAEERGLSEEEAEATRSDYESSPDDNQIISGIESSDTSLGWVGFAYAEEAGDGVREIPISEEPGGECVEPSDETISNDEYPLSRPLFIYVNNEAAESNEALAPFVDYYLENLNQLVEDAGYVTMPDAQVQETVSAWESR